MINDNNSYEDDENYFQKKWAEIVKAKDGVNLRVPRKMKKSNLTADSSKYTIVAVFRDKDMEHILRKY